jgi:outer membrane protein
MKKNILILIFILLSINIYSLDKDKKVEEKASEMGAFDVDGNKYIIRPLFGMAVESDLGELITFKEAQRDPSHGMIAGLQVERYVYKRPFDFPINLTLQSTFLVHTSDYKGTETDYYTDKNSYEINTGIKIYWMEFPWNEYVRTRLGVSEGISYINRITNIERYNQYHKNNSNYLNYIDVTLSFNAKDITRIKELEDTYVGMGISHRSGIFGTINDVEGGSNNVTFFFETEM